MHRTQMYLTDAEVARLDELAAERGTTRSDLVRQALAMAYGPMVPREERLAALRAAAGSWAEAPGEDRSALARAIHEAGVVKLRGLRVAKGAKTHGLRVEVPAQGPDDDATHRR